MASKKHYIHSEYTKRRLRLLYIIIVAVVILLGVGVLALRQAYNSNIKPVSSNGQPNRSYY